MRAGVALFCFALVASAAPSRRTHVYSKRSIYSSRTRPGKGFEPAAFVDQVTDDHILSMSIRLTQSNSSGLDAALADISDPSSPRYGQWLTRDEVATFTRPASGTVDAVTKWLSAYNITAETVNEVAEYLTFNVSVARANALLDANYTTFVNPDSGLKLVRTLSYSLPDLMQGHVTAVWPGSSFFNPQAIPKSAVKVVNRAANAVVTRSDSIAGQQTHAISSAQLRTLWNVVKRHAKPSVPVLETGRRVRANHNADLNHRGLYNVTRVRASVSDDRESARDLSVPILERDEESDILQKLNATLGGTLPADTQVIDLSSGQDISSLPQWLQDIIRGIASGQSGNATTITLPPSTQAPSSSSTVSVDTTTTTTTTITTTTTTITVPPATDDPTSSSSSSTETSSSTTTVSSSSSTETTTESPSPTSSASVPVGTAGNTDSSCQNEITPSCLQQLYGIPAAQAGNGVVGIGVTGYINQFAQHDDLRQFLSEFRKDVSSSVDFATTSIANGQNPQNKTDAGVEASLDVQWSVGLAPNMPVQFITVGDASTNGNGFLQTITTLIGQDSVPEVLTTSYGQDEEDVGADVAESMCDAYKQLTARGVSIIFSSGDSGVADSNGNCKNGEFQVTFPSGCPFVTSVGATDGVSPERGASFTGGGFSKLFSAPSFQTSHIQSYLSQIGNAEHGKFNSSGRAIPDVSAQGTKLVIVYQGKNTQVQGTSASAPVFASVIANLNAERKAVGLPSLGYLNPWLYSNASSALIDITQGSNAACGTNGFSAAAGWDPVTGLGTPSYAALRVAAGL